MLAQARERAVEAGVELDLREGDIRELEIEEPAALIYCPGRSLLHLPTWADRRRCFERVAASLRPDGRFAWNAFAFDHQTASAIAGKHADTPLPHTIRYSVGENPVDDHLGRWWNRFALVGNQTNGWDSSMSRACDWKLSMPDSPGSRSTTTATSTSS
jgi:Methyltransferase domain